LPAHGLLNALNCSENDPAHTGKPAVSGKADTGQLAMCKGRIAVS
jgi:hypothetical protein